MNASEVRHVGGDVSATVIDAAADLAAKAQEGAAAAVAGARVVAPALERFVGADGARRAGEWLARMILTYVVDPADSVDLADPVSVRRLVADFVVPGLLSVSNASRG